MTDLAYDPDNDTAGLTGDVGNSLGLTTEEAEDLSARARTQRRLTQARTAVSQGTIRARRATTSPTREKTEDTEGSQSSTASIVIDQVQAHRTYILGAAAALTALIAIVRRRRSAALPTDETVDLGDWHLSADVAES